MKVRNILLACICAVYLPVVSAQLSPEGDWVTIDDKTGEKRAVLHFAVKDGILTGTIAQVYPQPGDTGICSACPGEFKDKPVMGMQILWGLKETSPGAWDGGKILDAKTGRIYNVKMALKGSNKLYVRGYIGISMLGRTQIWERVS